MKSQIMATAAPLSTWGANVTVRTMLRPTSRWLSSSATASPRITLAATTATVKITVVLMTDRNAAEVTIHR